MGIVSFILITILTIGYVIYYTTNLIAEEAAQYLTEKTLIIAIIFGCFLFIIKIFIYIYSGLDKAYNYLLIIPFLLLNCAAQAFMFGSVLLNLSDAIIGSGFGIFMVTIEIIVSLFLIAIPSSINVGIDINISGILSDNKDNAAEKLDSKFLLSSCIKLLIAIIANIILGIMSNPYLLTD